MIPLDDGKKLLILAKDAIKAHFNRKEITVPSELREKYSENQGVFVTLMKDFDLRGCIGFPEPIMPLVEGIIKAAQSAGFEDPRFPPIEKSEELHAIGKEIYQKFGSELEKEHYGKYVIIIPAEQCGDDKHRMLVTKQRLFRDLSYVEELKKTYPEAAPYVAFIGDSKDNPDVMRI